MLTMLIAEKSEGLLDALKEAFCKEYEVYTCSRGDQALILLENLRPDILVINLRLPYTDGLTVLQEASWKPSRIVALTPIATLSVLQAAEAAGVQRVILIPCTTDAIVTQIRDLR